RIKTLPSLLLPHPAISPPPPAPHSFPVWALLVPGRLLRTELPRVPLHNQDRWRLEAPFSKEGGRKTRPPTLLPGVPRPFCALARYSSSNGHSDPPAGSFGAEKSPSAWGQPDSPQEFPSLGGKATFGSPSLGPWASEGCRIKVGGAASGTPAALSAEGSWRTPRPAAAALPSPAPLPPEQPAFALPPRDLGASAGQRPLARSPGRKRSRRRRSTARRSSRLETQRRRDERAGRAAARAPRAATSDPGLPRAAAGPAGSARRSGSPPQPPSWQPSGGRAAPPRGNPRSAPAATRGGGSACQQRRRRLRLG
ncbi:serine/arginine repetitive matrix protein 3-like, partial [Pantherophis guttatus]|uniref:Serine/arginine repetitive matrix protein 3-like n=1 Tax=Pantherophis guttatus TaxID=94885 RepID=A0ABM3ZL16_PANGU